MALKKEKREASIWDGIEEASVYDRGKYFKDGFVGHVKITKTLVKNSRKSGPLFIAELEVVETNDEEQWPIGWNGSWVVKMNNTDVAFPNIARFAGAVAGYTDPEDIKENVSPELKSIMQDATANEEDNDFIDEILKLETVEVETKEKKAFTRYDWFPATFKPKKK